MKALLLLPFLIGVAHATPTCVPGNVSSVTDPEYQAMLAYATHFRLQPTPTNVLLCTRDDGSAAYTIELPNTLASSTALGLLVWDPSAPASARAQLFYRKGRGQLIITMAGIRKTVYASDGSVLRYQYRGLGVVVNTRPTAARRLLRPRFSLAVTYEGNRGCAQYFTTLNNCLSALGIGETLNEATSMADDFIHCREDHDPVACGSLVGAIGVSTYNMITSECGLSLTQGSCYDASCIPGNCEMRYRTVPYCGHPAGNDRSDCVFCADPDACMAAGDCHCHDTTTTTSTTTTTTLCSNCPTEFCGVCGPVTGLGSPLPPGTGFGILVSMNNCNQCCPDPVDVCHSSGSTICCFDGLKAGDLYCCPSSCTSANPYCPQ